MILVKLLEEIPFFVDFTREEKQLLANNDSFFANLQPGEVLLREGTVDDGAFFVLVKGRVDVLSGEEDPRVLATLEPGTVLGEVAFLVGGPRTSTVVAHDPVTVFKVDAEVMQACDLTVQVKIKDNLLMALVGHLKECNRNLLRQKDINQTLARALHDLSLRIQNQRKES
ncbi:MAG: cyclic nucleotide-binding domain-containing protein [Magnetococcus sp. WYHC-3]